MITFSFSFTTQKAKKRQRDFISSAKHHFSDLVKWSLNSCHKHKNKSCSKEMIKTLENLGFPRYSVLISRANSSLMNAKSNKLRTDTSIQKITSWTPFRIVGERNHFSALFKHFQVQLHFLNIIIIIILYIIEFMLQL